ncbi:MAG TPA: hypothetical protein VLG44_01700 [Chlamydiales bacterium]|nr:hypothetical protein [Chlamydiales bacterium]
MKKAFSIIGIIIVAAAILVALYLWVIKPQIFSSYLSKKLGVQVSMLAVKLRPSYLVINNFKIANPRGSLNPTAFSAKTVEADYKWNNLTGNPVIIDQITLNDVFLEVELYNAERTEHNWTRIAEKISKDKDRDKEVIIKALYINNLDAQVYGLTGQAKEFLGENPSRHVDHLEFYNISSKEGFPTEELIQQIFGDVGFGDYLKGLLNPAKILPKVINPFHIFGENEGNEKAPSEDEALSIESKKD